MKDLIQRYFAWWYYQLKATNAHGLQSSFLFDLYNEAICDDKQYYAFSDIELLRAELLASTQTIEVTDFGAGSKVNKSKQRSIGNIAKYSLGSPATGRLLFRLVNFMRPKVIIELGTSLGINTLYQAAPRSHQQFYTFEGCPETAFFAAKLLEKQGQNVEVIVGNIDETLPQQLAQLNKIDYVMFDANHRYEPTMRYFEWCLAHASDDAVFIFDDIYWSAEMSRAWRELCAHERVKISIDLFECGILLMRNKQPKQHFFIRF